jgi:hypothetical protein
VHLLHGKGDKRCSIPIDSDALTYGARWLEVRRGLGISGPPTSLLYAQGRLAVIPPRRYAGESSY